MVANPINVFQTLTFGLLPGAMTQFTKARSASFVDQAQLCMESFTGRDEAEHDLPVDNPVLATLTTVVNRIVNSEVLEAIAQLIYWVNAMHFAALIMRFVTALIHWHVLTECLFIGRPNAPSKSRWNSLRWSLMIWVGLAVPRLEFPFCSGTTTMELR
jgi:hypothetical protein